MWIRKTEIARDTVQLALQTIIEQQHELLQVQPSMQTAGQSTRPIELLKAGHHGFAVFTSFRARYIVFTIYVVLT